MGENKYNDFFDQPGAWDEIDGLNDFDLDDGFDDVEAWLDDVESKKEADRQQNPEPVSRFRDDRVRRAYSDDSYSRRRHDDDLWEDDQPTTKRQPEPAGDEYGRRESFRPRRTAESEDLYEDELNAQQEQKKMPLLVRVAKRLGAAMGVLILAVVALLVVLGIYLYGKVDLVYSTDEETRAELLLSSYQDEFFESIEVPAKPGEDATEILPEVILPENISSVQTSDIINVILVGTDERTTEYSTNSRSDSITIVSINTKNNTLKLASMRRELPIPDEARGNEPNAYILTNYYRYFREQGVMDFFEEYLGVHIDYYIRVNFNAFVSIVDRMGGVDVKLTEPEAKYMNEQTLVHITPVQPGYQHLDGHQALIYARIRKIDSNLQRVRRQRNVLSQLANKGSTLSLADLNDIMNSVVDAVQTDMPEEVIVKLLTMAPQLLKTDLSSAENYISIPHDLKNLGDYRGNSKVLREFIYGES